MVSIALLDDFIEASRMSTQFSVEQLTREDPMFQTVSNELTTTMQCAPIAILRVSNPESSLNFAITSTAFHNLNLPLNETVLYHMTKSPLHAVCESGLTNGFTFRGLFGAPAVYLAESIKKANKYVSNFGDISRIRAVIRCRVLLGNVSEYPLGHFNPNLTKPPAGYQSVKGFVFGGAEYVIYSPSQILITDVIFYRVLSLDVEFSRVLAPSNFMGKVVFIPQAFAKLLSSILHNQRGRDMYVQVAGLLMGTKSISEFLTDYRLMFGDREIPEQARCLETMLRATHREVFIFINGQPSHPIPHYVLKDKIAFQIL